MVNPLLCRFSCYFRHHSNTATKHLTKAIFMTRYTLLLAIALSVSLASFAQKKEKQKDQGSDEVASSLNVQDACKKAESSEKIKSDITPFRLDKISTQKVFYKSYDQVKTVVVPVYHSTQYKFIINSEGLPTNVDIKVTDKPHNLSSAKVLKQASEKHFSFETPSDFSGSRIYIAIKIPADKEYQNGVRNRGCIVIGSGYSDLDF